MKKLNVFGFVVALGFVGLLAAPASVQAADRCAGVSPANEIQAESVQNMYFDMRMAELMCHYMQKDPVVLNKIAVAIGAFKTRYSSCIIAAQNKLIADLGTEGTFDNFYATLGNQLVLVQQFTPTVSPCDRAIALSKDLMKKKMSCGSELTATYAPWFSALEKTYFTNTKRTLHRVCDKTDS